MDLTREDMDEDEVEENFGVIDLQGKGLERDMLL